MRCNKHRDGVPCRAPCRPTVHLHGARSGAERAGDHEHEVAAGYPALVGKDGEPGTRGESAASALGRELHEELGIVVTSVSEHSFEQMHTPDVRLDIRLVAEWQGEPVNRAPDEHDAIGWFSSDELGTL